MKTTTKLYLKDFLISGACFGLLEYGLDVVQHKEPVYWHYISAAIFFGTGMTIWRALQLRKKVQ